MYQNPPQIADEPTLRGLDKVRVRKEQIIQIVKDNRQEHRTIFEEAIDHWHVQVQEKLKQMVKAAKEGPEAVVLAVNLPKPVDHTNDYDRTIKMLEMSLDDELELDEQEFAMYVMDDWGWQRQFLATSSAYSSRAADKAGKMS